MNKHYKITVRGVVQGVWFRAAAQQKARSLGLTGVVLNLPDGRVYAEAEGLEVDLLEFVNWCHQGPELAKVDEVLVTESTVQGFTDFEIKR